MDVPGGEHSGLRSRRRWALLAVCLWSAAVVVGFATLWRHDATPGVLGTPPVQWPANDAAALDPQRLTLVTFAHPHCPCTMATLGELARLLASRPEAFAATVAFYSDPELGPGWERSASWDRAASIPGVTVRCDPSGAAARTFAARTSGFTVVYTRAGDLVYHGGLTGSRGHEGDNPGAAAVLDLATGGGGAAVRSSAVYGCALFADADGGVR